MKKIIGLLCMAAVVLLAGIALADVDLTGMTIANGTVQASSHVDIVAPFSGTLKPFTLEMGDSVKSGEPIFSFLTYSVYAPEEGEVTALFAKEGEYASSVIARYGSLGAIESVHGQVIQASTTGAYNKNKNKEIHVGETLYFRNTNVTKEEGEGIVTYVQGDTFIVEMVDGTFDYGLSLSLYRNENYTNESKVGSGIVARKDPVYLQGSGLIESILVKKNENVSANQELMTLLPADAEVGASSVVSSPVNGVVSMIPVISGQQVWKGACLARIEITDQMEIVADVDEMDLSKIQVGSSFPVTLDIDPSRVLTGVVTEISGIGITKQNAAYYQVHLLVSSTDLPIGASANVYLPKN